MLLAVDAGNSKTEVALIDTSGHVLATSRGGGFNAHATGVPEALDVLAPLIRKVTHRADGDRPLPVQHVSACLSNVDLPGQERELTAALRERGWATTVRVYNDTFAVLRAGLPDTGGAGIAVVCGAGINCVGLTAEGRTVWFPAVGTYSGDWGGGGQLAEEALWHAARSEDGRGGPTALARALPRHFGLTSMMELISALHLRSIPATRRYEMVPVLFRTAEEGDEIARSLIHRQAEEIVLLATATLERLGPQAAPLPLFLGGGILAARHPLLNDRIRDLLTTRAPHLHPTVLTTP
ncbi:N-acetylglucosamine kinase, partial [Streptomyces sp. WAC06614]|uniref:N-acetylglucosamine kinase n=1 Tax=Streptomyces sp. WAC06614 TaxID=2487416 RepID=UPI000F773F13